MSETPATTLPITAISLDAQPKGELALNAAYFGLTARADILQRMVTYQLAKRRVGSAATKPRSDIRGTGKKSIRQKGTGSARHGNRKANIFRGGGKAHGPVQRSHRIGLPKRVRRLALCHALSSKYAAKELMILDAAVSENGKTGVLRKQLQQLKIDNALIIDGGQLQTEFSRAAANIAQLDVLPVQGINVYDILRHKLLVITKTGLEGLHARLGGSHA